MPRKCKWNFLIFNFYFRQLISAIYDLWLLSQWEAHSTSLYKTCFWNEVLPLLRICIQLFFELFNMTLINIFFKFVFQNLYISSCTIIVYSEFQRKLKTLSRQNTHCDIICRHSDTFPSNKYVIYVYQHVAVEGHWEAAHTEVGYSIKK